MRVLDGIRDMLKSKSAVQMVADDPQMAAELLLLLRIIFVDGKMVPAELDMFKLMCRTIFKMEEEDVPDVIRFLKDYGYETSGAQAAAMFTDMDPQRKRELIVNLIAMARADDRVHENEVDLIGRVGLALGYTTDEIETWL